MKIEYLSDIKTGINTLVENIEYDEKNNKLYIIANTGGVYSFDIEINDEKKINLVNSY